jgi:NDP-sugar pyrophosphorylase family protein
MIIVIPMAGLSRRFTEAGYLTPKYMLKCGGISIFRHAILSFEALFGKVHFLFVFREIEDTARFIEDECIAMGLTDFSRVRLDVPTRGQAETVAIALRQVRADVNESLLIFNIDTIRPGYRLPAIAAVADGYLEVFRGEGDGWSFVAPAEGVEHRVTLTTEKRRVSNLCSTGLYYFRRCVDFLFAFDEELVSGPSDANEFYVAPLYNKLIRRGLDIRYELIDAREVYFSGVPQEYEALCARADMRSAESKAQLTGESGEL